MAKIKKCKQCGNSFTPYYSALQVVCGPECALKFNSKKESDKRVKQMRKDLKTHKDYVQTLQTVFNTFIRLRDKHQPCISCGKPLEGKYDAGHFFPTTKQSLRFNEDNVHGQCVHCNQHLHGNITKYSYNLPKRIGWERFEALYELEHKEFKVSIEWIKEKIIHYKNKIKDYEKNKSNIKI